jgi:hypothetical protein
MITTMPSLTIGPEKPTCQSVFHTTGGPLGPQLAESFGPSLTPLRFGPRNWNQSAPAVCAAPSGVTLAGAAGFAGSVAGGLASCAIAMETQESINPHATTHANTIALLFTVNSFCKCTIVLFCGGCFCAGNNR